MKTLFWRFLIMAATTVLSACGGGGGSDKADFDMLGLWSVSIMPEQTVLIDITSQDSGKFSGAGGAYLVEGVVEGNSVGMSIYIPGSVNCDIFIQTHTEEIRIDVGKN